MTGDSFGDNFVASLDPLGAHRWSLKWTSNPPVDADIAVSPGDEVYVVGQAAAGRLGTAFFSGLREGCSVAQLSAAGMVRWADQIGIAEGRAEGCHISAGAAHAYVAGNIRLPSFLRASVIAVVSGADGSRLWSRQYGGRPNGIATGPDRVFVFLTTLPPVGAVSFEGTTLSVGDGAEAAVWLSH